MPIQVREGLVEFLYLEPKDMFFPIKNGVQPWSWGILEMPQLQEKNKNGTEGWVFLSGF